jgi:hypothetical protein
MKSSIDVAKVSMSGDGFAVELVAVAKFVGSHFISNLNERDLNDSSLVTFIPCMCCRSSNLNNADKQ